MTGRVLIVDDLAVNRIILKAKLGSACYAVQSVAGGVEALELARRSVPDVIVLDLALADMDGVDLCRALAADPATAHIPLLVVTGAVPQARRLAALEAGARDVMVRPLDENTFLARIRNLLRDAESEADLRRQETLCREHGFAEAQTGFETRARVAILGGAPRLALGLRRQIAAHCHDVDVETLGPAGALNTAAGAPVPDLFLIMPGSAGPAGVYAGHGAGGTGGVGAADGDGLRVLLDLTARRTTRHSAFVVVLPANAVAQAAMALDLGAHDILWLPVDPAEAALRIRAQLARKCRADARRRAVETGLNLAAIDPLTGLLNRRSMMPQLLRLTENSRSTGRSFALMLLDLDRFKAINDTHGHGVGDQVLRIVSERLRRAVRPVDILARHGGEEFLLALPDVTLSEARARAEALCRVIGETVFEVPGGSVQVTASVGMTLCGGAAVDLPARGDTAGRAWLEGAIEAADRALLRAKSDGRNQVMVGQSAA